jgi:hypothetical protein
MTKLISVSDANALIKDGLTLHIAGDEKALKQLAPGNWIGGTIPYFLTESGGVVDHARVLVTELPAAVIETKIAFVHALKLDDIVKGGYDNGFTIVIIPGGSNAHSTFATAIHDVAGLYETPVIGWIAGVHLDDIGKVAPLVIDGRTGETSANGILVLHAKLADGVNAQVGIINLFEQGSGDTFQFPETGFTADACLINGEPASLYDYIKARNLDLRLPLVADQSGEMINVSFQTLEDATHTVRFYAPVLKGEAYRQAAPTGDYRKGLAAKLETRPVTPAFSCNCILNFVYGGLEGDQPVAIPGPATFGEIAYVLLNQTLVYLEIG